MQIKIRKTAIWGIAILLGMAGLSEAAGFLHIKQKMNYQGMLTNSSGTPYTGTRSMVFRLYDQVSGGSNQWTETQSSVAVTNGIFNVVLGSVNPINIPFREEYWLEIQVETETLTPRHLLSNAAYAMASRKVVYQQVITVAQDGGDTCTVYGALQLISQESPTPSLTDQWVIEVQAGTFTETNSLSIPDGVVVRGQGWNATAITLPSSGTISLGSNCGLEGLTINLQGISGSVSMAGAFVTNSYIRKCNVLATATGTGAINLANSINCFVDSCRIIAQTSGNYMIYLSGATDARIENNFIDVSAITNSTAIRAPGITRCIITKNTIKLEGATDSTYGIQIDNSYSSSRISYNVFYGEATTPQASDIYNTSNTAYPVRPAHTGGYGICNHGSSGSELPAF